MNPLFRLLAGHLGDQVEHSLKRAFSPVAPYLRRLAMGVVFLFLGALCFSLTLILLGTALFAHISGYSHLVDGALWTALVFAVLCSVFGASGIRMLRRPR